MCRSSSSVPHSPARLDPAEALHAAVHAADPEERGRLAAEGLEALERRPEEADPALRALLWRQLHRARLDQGDLEGALEAARAAAGPGAPMPEVLLADQARVLMALGREQEAIEAQRRAARLAPPEKRAFHQWTLAAMLQEAGRLQEAERTLRSALRWARGERELLEAHLLWVALDRGDEPPAETLLQAAEALGASAARGGYGELLRGVLRAAAGQREEARALLGRFVERIRKGPVGRRIALRFELRRAERLLARLADA